MPAKRTCSECGARLPDNGLGNRCPKCLLRLGLEQSSQGAASEQTAIVPESDTLLERTGVMIGPYKLLQQIGEGGFGVVFMAEQTEPVQRKVALKIIKAGMDTKEVIARFEAERQAISLMDHPNIARALDAGATAAGRPYFVMELVRGIPITEYCDQNNLSTPERLNLFIKVCGAIQHAHQKGIIHRDIKPSNVMVTLHDGEPVPKVIDFGVAKALGRKLTNKTLFTRFEQMLGTPAYMSPEQAALSGLDVDTRSDIYSLGVLLYELLTGVTPFDADTLRQAALDEIRRMIQETVPPKPSTRLQTLGARLMDVAKHRHAEPAVLRRLLRDDLDWITMKALEKDRHRRYETANGLAMDIKRYLNSEPVVARPPSKLYRFERLVRRNKLAFAAAGGIAAALVLGVILYVGGVKSEQRKTEEARKELEAALIKEKAAHQQAVRAEEAKLVLEQKAQRIEESQSHLREQIERADAAVRKESLAGQLQLRGELAEAETLYRESAAAYSELFGSNSLAAIHPLGSLAFVLHREGKLEEAEAAFRQAVEGARGLSDSVSAKLSVLGLNLHHLADVLLEREALEDARVFASQAVAIYQKHAEWPDREREHALSILGGVAEALARQGNPEEAREVWNELLEFVRKWTAATGQHEPRSGWILHHMAEFLQKHDQPDEAYALADEAVSLYQSHSDWPANERAHAERVRQAALTNMANAVVLQDGTVVPQLPASARRTHLHK